MKNLLRGISALLLCVAAVALAHGNGAAATATNNTNTLKVSPVRTSITVQPGTTGIVKTYVTNLTKSPVIIHPIENDFVAGDENGTPSIILDENSYAPTHSLKRFMTPLQNVTINAGDTKEIDVSIVVPKTAQAGGYFGAVRYAPATSDNSQSVNLSASVASLILMTVPGPTTENLILTNFDIQQYGSTVATISKPDGVSVLVRFANKGNLQEAPFGQIYVQKGKKVVYRYNFNQTDPKDYVLPDGARRWTVPLKGFDKFGKYKVSGTFTYGTKGESVSVSKTIWVIPTGYLIAGGAIIVGLIVLGILIWLLLRMYKRRIIRKSSRRRY